MSKEYIKKAELAKIFGTSAPYMTKIEKNGVFEGCYEDDELKRFEAIEAYINNIDFSRDSQREANAAKRDDKIQYISKKDLASAFGVSAPRITALDKEGIFEGCYDGKKLRRLEAIRAYVEKHSKKKANKEDENIDDKDFEPQTVEDIRIFYKLLIAETKSPLQKASIAKEEDIKIEKFLKNQELEKNLVNINDVQKEAFEAARKVRDAFLSLPDRISSQLVKKERTEIHSILKNEINYILESLTNE